MIRTDQLVRNPTFLQPIGIVIDLSINYPIGGCFSWGTYTPNSHRGIENNPKRISPGLQDNICGQN
ncbi:8389_t:CDS:2 [Ambispora gerdemannii]|uniref:8389_t:CDS:1 n=1 Tax=Ambispora gerdemannii TaxID=144530 RepID=A0A9N8VB69_9GLOM|nr:8389_t:CDS:2 [Ambispora gerdemannii]